MLSNFSSSGTLSLKGGERSENYIYLPCHSNNYHNVAV